MAVLVGLDGIFPSNSIFTFWTQVFEKNGTFRYQFGIPGKEEGQLWYPRKVSIYISQTTDETTVR